MNTTRSSTSRRGSSSTAPSSPQKEIPWSTASTGSSTSPLCPYTAWTGPFRESWQPHSVLSPPPGSHRPSGRVRSTRSIWPSSGAMHPREGRIDIPLRNYETGVMKEALTEYRRLATAEMPVPSRRFPTSRFSLVEVRLPTGRFHQIRRHLARLGYPIVGGHLPRRHPSAITISPNTSGSGGFCSMPAVWNWTIPYGRAPENRSGAASPFQKSLRRSELVRN